MGLTFIIYINSVTSLNVQLCNRNFFSITDDLRISLWIKIKCTNIYCSHKRIKLTICILCTCIPNCHCTRIITICFIIFKNIIYNSNLWIITCKYYIASLILSWCCELDSELCWFDDCCWADVCWCWDWCWVPDRCWCWVFCFCSCCERVLVDVEIDIILILHIIIGFLWWFSFWIIIIIICFDNLSF